MAETWIYVEHPDVKGDPALVTLESFLNLYERKGWVAMEDPPISTQESNRETFSRVFGNVPKKDAVKGPKKKAAKK
jgi:hypothetical protein